MFLKREKSFAFFSFFTVDLCISWYSAVSIKLTGGNKRTGWADCFHLLHKERVQGGAKTILLHEKWDEGGEKLQNS